MKHIIFMILMLPLVFAMYGGESEVVKNFTDCYNLSIYVEGEQDIDIGEYKIKDCTEVNTNLWYCICNDGFNVTLETKSNTINKYNLTINYTQIIEKETPNNGGGHSGSGGTRRISLLCISEWKCTEWSECINSFKRRDCIDINNCSISIKPNVSKKCNVNNKPPIHISEPKVEEPKVDEPKVEEPKAEEPKAEEPKAEEPKKDMSTLKLVGIVLGGVCSLLLIIVILLYFYLRESPNEKK